MVRKNGTRWILGITVAFCMACVSGSIRSVHVTNDLPSDLPKDLKDRFEIKEASEFKVANPPTPAASQPESPIGKSKRKRKKHGKKNRELAIVLSPTPSEMPLVYPFRRP